MASLRHLSVGCAFVLALGSATPGNAEREVEFRQHPFLEFDAEQSYSADVTLVDADNDGDLDVLLANERHWAQQDYLFLNAGEGRLLEARPVGELSASYTIRAGDLDGDGDPDAVLIRDLLPALVLSNDAEGGLRAVGEVPASAGSARSAELIDIDDDEALDLIIVTRREPDRVYRGDGRGGFHEGVDLPDEGCGSTGIAAADIDLDGDLDLVIARRDGVPSVVMTNEGSGSFAAMPLRGSAGDHRKAAVADFDADGRPDIALVSTDGLHSLYQRDASGEFAQTHSFGEKGEAVQALASGDIDGDGDIDLVAGADGPNVLYLNDGAGFFQRRIIPGEADTYGVALGDMNGDGAADIVFANSGSMNEVVLSKGRSAED